MKGATRPGLRSVRLLLLAALTLFGQIPGAQADYPLEIIELQGRQSDEMIPIVQPLVGADGAVTGMGNKLIVRTSPERMQEIRKVLRQLDRPPRRLMIYVRQGRLIQADLAYAAAGVNLGGDHGRADTQVQGRLGQWLSLGGTSESVDQRAAGILAGGSSISDTSSEIHVLVEELP